MPARSEGDISHMESADFEADQPRRKNKPTDRPRHLEGLPEDLWKD